MAETVNDGIDWAEHERRHKVRGETVDVIEVADPEKLGRAYQITAAGTQKAFRVTRAPLDKMASEKMLTPEEYRAGCDLRDKYSRAFAGGACSNYDGVPAPDSYGPRSVPDHRIDALSELKAIRREIGREHYGVLVCIVCMEEPILIYAQRHSIHYITARQKIFDALTALTRI